MRRCLVGVVLAVALLDPSKPFLGTDWHPWMYLREMVQLGLVAISLWFGDQRGPREESIQLRRDHRGGRAVHRHLHLHAAGAADSRPSAAASWASTRRPSSSGRRAALSSVLDNAPTYLVFFKTAQAMPARRRRRARSGRRSIDPGRDQPRRRLHGRDDLHRQRPEFHGQSDRRIVGRQNAQLLRLHGLQLRDPVADPGAHACGCS